MLVPHAGHHLAVIDVRIGRTLGTEHAGQAALGSAQSMIDQGEVARHLHLEFGIPQPGMTCMDSGRSSRRRVANVTNETALIGGNLPLSCNVLL